MAVQCVCCRHLTFREHPGTTVEGGTKIAKEMAKRHGIGRCLQGDHFRFLSPTRPRECEHFAAANDEQVSQRLAWLTPPTKE